MFSRWVQPSEASSALVIGPRRAGKTTLLRSLFPAAPYLTLDDYDVLKAARDDPKGLLRALEGSPVILDEIQRAPEILIAVKLEIDQRRRRFLLTGSSTLGLLSAGSETLAGRIGLTECPTACWGEEEGPPTHRLFTMPPSPLAIAEANRRLPAALHFGGFPEVITAPTEADKVAILQNYKNTYFARDLLQLANIENADGLMAMLHYLAVSLGSHTDVSNAARESGLSHPTARKYLNVLQASRLCFKLYGYHFGPAKRFTRAAKHYFADSGILTALGATTSPGAQLEGFVIAEIEKRRKLGFIRCDMLHYYRSVGGAEIDLVIDEPDCTTAIEIKHTSRPARRDVRHVADFVAATDRKKRRRGILLCMGQEASSIDGVEILPIAHLHRAGGK